MTLLEKKILFVEDDEAIRQMYERSFYRKGWMVRTASSGRQALEIMQSVLCDVVFIDLKLPDISGFDLCRKIKRKFPQSRCYAVSGDIAEFESEDNGKHGFDRCFEKPVKLSVLADTAENTFKKISDGHREDSEDANRFPNHPQNQAIQP